MLKAAVSDECVTDKQPAMVLIVEDNQKNAEIMQEFLALEDIG